MNASPAPSAQTLPTVEGRDIAALQDPRPICLIGACAGDGAPANFATVIWVTPVSHKPPMIAFALREKARTMELLRESGAFSVSTLPAAADAAALAEFCGSTTGHAVDKGKQVEHFIVHAERTDGDAACAPVPTCALSWVACAVESVQEAGDHLLVVGRVREARIDAPRDERGRLVPAGTLLCVQHGTYAKGAVLDF